MAKKNATLKKTVVKKVVKKIAPKTAPVKKAAPPVAAPLPKVRVQMFRQGLGDSFLVTLDADGPHEQRMLIDCGTLGNSFSDTNPKAIAAYLKTFVDAGRKIDVLVATHEHQDHVSGFRKDLQDVLKGQVGQVWLAWTENPEDADARDLARFTGDLGNALRQIARLSPGSDVCALVQDLVGFSGEPGEAAEPLLGAKFATTVNEAMEFVRTGTGGQTKYLNPGTLIEEGFNGFRIYVLGPPRDRTLLGNMGSHHSQELFGLASVLGATAALHLNTEHSPASDLPFDERYNQTGPKLLQQQYPEYVGPESDWRRIDLDWIAGAADLALQLDKLTNNTSLALAIERIADGKVLLFPADAQEGNWLSWHDAALNWTVVGLSGTPHVVTAADLLSRTVFYKVGHHGSHNATAKGKGLELMTNQDELVAFIPVDRALALTRNPKNSWQMPARALYKALLQHCQGRVVRADLGWAAPSPDGDPVEDAFRDMEEPDQWDAWKEKQRAATHVKVTDPLFFEYTLM